MDQTAQIIVAFSFGVIFLIALLVIAIVIPNPTAAQYKVFRIVLSIAAAGAAAMVPGFLNIEFNPTTGFLVRAGGALAVFVIVYFFNPASLVANAPDSALPPSSLPPPPPPSNDPAAKFNNDTSSPR
jgi:hypothetical protein